MSKLPAEAVRKQIIGLIPVYMNVFMMGCANGWLPNVMYFMMHGQEVHATSGQCALIASFSELGRIIFAIPAGILTDKYGRKNITVIIGFLHFFTWLGLSLNTSLVTIYIGRLVLGAVTAMVNATALISIGEIASPENRGQLTSIYRIFMHIGAILPSIISVTFSAYKSLAWAITIFSIISLLSMFWVVETPSFLISVSKLEQARVILQEIRQGYQQSDINNEFEKLRKYIEDEKARKSQLSWLKFLKSKAIRRPLFTGTLLNFFTIATGGILIRIYITAVIPPHEFLPKKYYPLILQIILLFIAFTSTFYIDKFPRRIISLFGASALMVTNAVCALTSYLEMENQIGDTFKCYFILSTILSIIFYGASIQPMSSTIKAELYPQAVKGFCGSVGVISQSISAIILYQVYNFIKDHFHIYIIYVIFSINSFILFLVTYFLLPEARGVFLTDLQMKFKGNPQSNNV
ncbi:glucose transporter GlcP-like [Planococcus citri]|uniref:glucose transporter GlcP-like n=1 Tax=Planococcus citri TaxID=170843 RepID=UPI0031F78025